MRRELHKLTRIDSVACQKIESVTIGGIRVEGFVLVARTAPRTLPIQVNRLEQYVQNPAGKWKYIAGPLPESGPMPA